MDGGGDTVASGGTGVLSCTAAPVQAVRAGVELAGVKLHSFLLKNPYCYFLVCNSELTACCGVG